MKSVCIFWLIFLFYYSNVYPQWTNQNLVPEGNNLWSTFFVDDNTGWIIGTEGFIKKTSNAGLDWIQQNSGTTLTLKSVQFINQNTGWICGEEGLIIKTSNGGQSWIKLTSGTTEILTDLHFYNQDIGYVVGYNETILKTTDGGINWATQQSGSNYDLLSVDFVDDFIGFAVGGKDSCKFLKTTDGGLNWFEKSFIISYWDNPKLLNCVEFINQNIGWVGTGTNHYNYGKISKTTDGGETWFSSGMYRPILEEDSLKNDHEVDNLNDTQKGIRSIFFKDSINGYAVGGTKDGWRRSIFTTTDAGATWQPNYNYSEQTGLLSIFVNSTGQGWAVGYRGVIYKTGNDGSAWTQILSGTQVGYTGDWITSVFMVNESVGWAAGYRKGIWYYPIILKTTNGGKIWETNSELSESFSWTSANIFFLNERIGWVNFYDKGSFKTTDGGENWFASGNAGNENYFINQDTGWGTYEPLGVFKSTDGGSTWAKKSSVSCRSIHFSNSDNGWAVGMGGSILKSVDGGENWILKASGTSSDLNSVYFYNNNIGMCVGNSGTILLSSDGGENWVLQDASTTSNLNSVLFTNSTTIWISGSEGTILYTSDLGNTWSSYDGITANDLLSESFINEHIGWFAGWNGTVLKYENDIVPVELTSFRADVNDSKVELNWRTATELNNLGYDIERNVDHAEWVKIGFVEGSGNSGSPKSYSYIDTNPLGGNKFYYRLKQLDTDGKYEYSNEIEVELLPTKFVLYQNYPNPFNPTTKIRFQLARGSQVTIKIYDILGSEVLTLLQENKEPGTYEVELNAESLSSGTYIYRIESNDPSTGSPKGQAGQSFVQVKKMILLK